MSNVPTCRYEDEQYVCPRCDFRMKYPAHREGRRLACTNCAGEFFLPDGAPRPKTVPYTRHDANFGAVGRIILKSTE